MQHEDEYPVHEYGEGSILTTWNISYEQVKQQNPSAIYILALWGHLGNKGVSMRFLRSSRAYFRRRHQSYTISHGVATAITVPLAYILAFVAIRNFMISERVDCTDPMSCLELYAANLRYTHGLYPHEIIDGTRIVAFSMMMSLCLFWMFSRLLFIVIKIVVEIVLHLRFFKHTLLSLLVPLARYGVDDSDVERQSIKTLMEITTNKTKLFSAIVLLEHYSLIQPSQESKSRKHTWSMHPVVHQWCYHTVSKPRGLVSAATALELMVVTAQKLDRRQSRRVQQLTPHLRSAVRACNPRTASRAEKGPNLIITRNICRQLRCPPYSVPSTEIYKELGYLAEQSYKVAPLSSIRIRYGRIVSTVVGILSLPFLDSIWIYTILLLPLPVTTPPVSAVSITIALFAIHLYSLLPVLDEVGISIFASLNVELTLSSVVGGFLPGITWWPWYWVPTE